MYITEEGLYEYLKLVFPDTDDWLLNQRFAGHNIRPDYQSRSLNLIVEFDGFRHYTQSSVIVNDEYKDGIYAKEGYIVARMPYFVQPSTNSFINLFGKSVAMDQAYPHGFVDSKVVMPCDFCELGVKRFKHDLERFGAIYPSIISSLKSKIAELKIKDKRFVLPESLFYLVERT